MEIISGKPYTDSNSIRRFDHSVLNEEFVWHRDKKDRTITVLEGQGWQLQYNGWLPIELIEGREYHIPAMMYHRILKGANDLIININE